MLKYISAFWILHNFLFVQIEFPQLLMYSKKITSHLFCSRHLLICCWVMFTLNMFLV